jgi:hypothetical protein
MNSSGDSVSRILWRWRQTRLRRKYATRFPPSDEIYYGDGCVALTRSRIKAQ